MLLYLCDQLGLIGFSGKGIVAILNSAIHVITIVCLFMGHVTIGSIELTGGSNHIAIQILLCSR